MRGRAESLRASSSSLGPPHAAALAIAMAVAAALLLHAGRGLGFTGDELFAYARLVDGPGDPRPYAFGLEYLMAPHNGHLQLGGKLIYEASFAAFGAAHEPFRILGLGGILAGAAVFAVLAARRVGALVATVATILLLFMGAAWEPMLWPYDLHTTYALAAGLGAVLAHESRRGALGDVAVCALLLVALSMIEVGVVFVVVVAVRALSGPDRVRRAWPWAVPLLTYACWWVWARQFEHEGPQLSNVVSLPGSIAESAVAVSAAVTGQYAHGEGVFSGTLDPNAAAWVVAALLAGGLVWLVAREGVRRAASPFLLGALVYWTMIGLASRPEDSSRYMWVGAILVLLGTFDLLAGAAAARRGPVVACLLAACVAVALPAGREKLADGRAAQLADSAALRAQFGIVDAEGAPTYRAGADPLRRQSEPQAITAIDPRAYLGAAARIGRLGFSAAQLRAQSPLIQQVADVTAARLLGVRRRPSPVPGRLGCRRVTPPSRAGSVRVGLSPRGALLMPASQRSLDLGLGRFSRTYPAFALGKLAPREWVELIPPRTRTGPGWVAYVSGPVTVCRLA